MVLLYKFAAVLLLWPGTGSGPSTGPDSSITRTQVDLIELNHFMDEEGREVRVRASPNPPQANAQQDPWVAWHPTVEGASGNACQEANEG